MSFLRRVWTWVLSNKLAVLFFFLTEAFVIATVWLAIDKASLSSELDECRKNNSALTSRQSQSITESTDFTSPTNIRPDAYDLHLYPDLATGLLGGRIFVNFTVLEPTNTLKIRSNGLSLIRLEVEDAASTFALDSEEEVIVITTIQELPVGSRYVDMEFAGNMKNTAATGSPKATLTSRFQPAYTRQAFPYFDEPSLKANFKVHLLKPSDLSYITLSNMAVAYEETVPEGVLVHFEDRVKTSTYLTCFIV